MRKGQGCCSMGKGLLLLLLLRGSAMKEGEYMRCAWHTALAPATSACTCVQDSTPPSAPPLLPP